MSDELRDVLEKVVDQAEANPDKPLEPVVAASEEIKEEPKATPPAIGEKSSELPETGQKAAPTPAPTPAAAPVEKKEPEGKKEPEAHVTERAPASWTKEAKESWATVPLQARQEILRREGEINKVLQESAGARQAMEGLQGVLQPHLARLQSQNVHPFQAIKNLMEVDNFLQTAPPTQRAAFMAKLISDYKVDINELDSALGSQLQGRANPAMDIQAAVQQAIQPLMAPIQNWQQQQAQSALREQQEATQAVQRMELDPKYEFFPIVREYMADLVDMHAKRGLALSLEDAYTMAVQTHPETSAISKERAEQEAARQALERGSQAAQRARSAAVSVGSSVPVGGSSNPAAGMNLRDTIEAAWTAAGSGGRI